MRVGTGWRARRSAMSMLSARSRIARWLLSVCALLALAACALDAGDAANDPEVSVSIAPLTNQGNYSRAYVLFDSSGKALATQTSGSAAPLVDPSVDTSYPGILQHTVILNG